MTQNSSAAQTQFSPESERHGLLARVIENWLISANERQYQLPFCQVLAASGETILYTSTHGPFEKGKDIITRTPTGEIRIPTEMWRCGAVGVEGSVWRGK